MRKGVKKAMNYLNRLSGRKLCSLVLMLLSASTSFISAFNSAFVVSAAAQTDAGATAGTCAAVAEREANWPVVQYCAEPAVVGTDNQFYVYVKHSEEPEFAQIELLPKGINVQQVEPLTPDMVSFADGKIIVRGTGQFIIHGNPATCSGLSDESACTQANCEWHKEYCGDQSCLHEKKSECESAASCAWDYNKNHCYKTDSECSSIKLQGNCLSPQCLWQQGHCSEPEYQMELTSTNKKVQLFPTEKCIDLVSFMLYVQESGRQRYVDVKGPLEAFSGFLMAGIGAVRSQLDKAPKNAKGLGIIVDDLEEKNSILDKIADLNKRINEAIDEKDATELTEFRLELEVLRNSIPETLGYNEWSQFQIDLYDSIINDLKSVWWKTTKYSYPLEKFFQAYPQYRESEIILPDILDYDPDDITKIVIPNHVTQEYLHRGMFASDSTVSTMVDTAIKEKSIGRYFSLRPNIAYRFANELYNGALFLIDKEAMDRYIYEYNPEPGWEYQEEIRFKLEDEEGIFNEVKYIFMTSTDREELLQKYGEESIVFGDKQLKDVLVPIEFDEDGLIKHDDVIREIIKLNTGLIDITEDGQRTIKSFGVINPVESENLVRILDANEELRAEAVNTLNNQGDEGLQKDLEVSRKAVNAKTNEYVFEENLKTANEIGENSKSLSDAGYEPTEEAKTLVDQTGMEFNEVAEKVGSTVEDVAQKISAETLDSADGSGVAGKVSDGYVKSKDIAAYKYGNYINGAGLVALFSLGPRLRELGHRNNDMTLLVAADVVQVGGGAVLLYTFASLWAETGSVMTAVIQTLALTVDPINLLSLSEGTLVPNIPGFVIFIVAHVVVNYLWCAYVDPTSVACGCSANPAYGKMQLELAKSTIDPGGGVGFSISGMQHCAGSLLMSQTYYGTIEYYDETAKAWKPILNELVYPLTGLPEEYKCKFDNPICTSCQGKCCQATLDIPKTVLQLGTYKIRGRFCRISEGELSAGDCCMSAVCRHDYERCNSATCKCEYAESYHCYGGSEYITEENMLTVSGEEEIVGGVLLLKEHTVPLLKNFYFASINPIDSNIVSCDLYLGGAKEISLLISGGTEENKCKVGESCVTGQFYSFDSTGTYKLNVVCMTDKGTPISGPETDITVTSLEKLKILAVPLNWVGTQQEFETEFNKQLEFFIQDLPIKNCKDKIVTKFLSVETENFEGFTCSEHDSLSVEDFAEKKGYDSKNYDIIVGAAKGSPCTEIVEDEDLEKGTTGGTRGIDDAWIAFADPAALAHEFGHIFGLRDQYCCKSLGSKGGWCTVAGEPTKEYPNPLNERFGCNPYDTSCCNFDEDNQCSGYSICCYGNKNSRGGRSVMSYKGAPTPRGFDVNEIKHLSKLLDCTDESEELTFIQLKQGWNMISTPYNTVTFDTSDCTLFSKAYHYHPTASSIYDTIDVGDMEGGVGYWVYSYSKPSCEVKLSGQANPISEPTEFSAGWTQIAVPPQGLKKDEIQCDQIKDPMTWNTETQGWVQVQSMAPGKSYFVDCYPKR